MFTPQRTQANYTSFTHIYRLSPIVMIFDNTSALGTGKVDSSSRALGDPHSQL